MKDQYAKEICKQLKRIADALEEKRLLRHPFGVFKLKARRRFK